MELNLSRFVDTNKELAMMLDLCRKSKFNLLKPLVQASKDKNPIVQWMNYSTATIAYKTLLHNVSTEGRLDIVKIIVPSLSDKNPKQLNGYTPLHYAASKGHLEIVMYLCDQLQDKNPKGNNGTTPLHLAAENGNTEIVKYLVSVIDDKHPKTVITAAAFVGGFKITPLDLARRNGHTEIVNILEKYKN